MRIFPSENSKPFARMINVHMGFNDAVSKKFRCLLFLKKIKPPPLLFFLSKKCSLFVCTINIHGTCYCSKQKKGAVYFFLALDTT